MIENRHGSDPVLTTSRIEIPQTEQHLPSIAVLPFQNLSADPDQEYFCGRMGRTSCIFLESLWDVPLIRTILSTWSLRHNCRTFYVGVMLLDRFQACIPPKEDLQAAWLCMRIYVAPYMRLMLVSERES